MLGLAALLWTLLLYACSSPTGGTDPENGNEARITISLGDGALNRAGFSEDGIGDYSAFTFELDLAPVTSGGKITNAPQYNITPASATASAVVTSGYWDITLKAYYPTPANLYAEGSILNLEIKPNQNVNIPIEMDRPGGPYTVSYNLNGGTGTAADSTGKTILPGSGTSTFARAGYVFLYWERPSDLMHFDAGTSYTPDSDHTLKAVWQPKDLTISVTNPINSLTPIVSTLAAYPAHDERGATFSISIPELDPGETVTVGLATNSYGLSLTGSTTVTGPASVTLILSYTGTTTVTQTTPVNIGLTVSTAGYNLTGSPAVSAIIIDGQASTRAIPLTNSNVKYFNIFTTDPSTKTTGLALHYYLTENIIATNLRTAPTDLAPGNNWVAIGDDTNQFTGSFDGCICTITGLEIDVASHYQGMFGCIARNGTDTTTGVVKGLGLVNSSVIGLDFTGGVVGDNATEGSITNCYFEGSVTGGTHVGGVAGRNFNSSMVQNCYAEGQVNGAYRAGGVVGNNEDGSTVQNCYAICDVEGSDDYVGGVVGDNYGGTVQYCYATGYISGSAYVGGIVGRNTSYATVKYCMALSNSITNTGAGTNFGRVAGLNNLSTLTGNRGRDDMLVKGITVPGPNLDTSIEGEEVDDTFWQYATNWNSPMNFQSTEWDLSGVDTINLPTLHNMPGPAGAQNPQVIP